MKVVKRSGALVDVKFDKIASRLKKLADREPVLESPSFDTKTVAAKVCAGVYNGVTTKQLDRLAAQTAAMMATEDYRYSDLAGRIVISMLHKDTEEDIFKVYESLYNHVQNEQPSPLVTKEMYEFVKKYHKNLMELIQYENDYLISYFGAKTLMKSYLMKIDGNIIERPQHMWMRVAIAIWEREITKYDNEEGRKYHNDEESKFDTAWNNMVNTYQGMSRLEFTHASPTLFNAGTQRPQLSSCFLLTMQDDSIEGIYDTLKQCALISKSAGGIGLACHNVRSKGSYIKGTNGTSNGIVPMLRVFNNTARYVDQGGGKRNGAFACYLEPWHADIFDFLKLRLNTGENEERARDLFYGLWISDLFMKRVKEDGHWTLFCPNVAKGLSDTHSKEHEKLYLEYERDGLGERKVRARELWERIINSQIETGTPYMLYKDACNSKSNQQNLGTIKSSNLCTEIIQYTSPEEIAVCNLASISLKKMVYVDEQSGEKRIAFQKLIKIVRQLVKNLNKIIDINFYPVEEARTSNMKHRPIGIGVQGLADLFFKLDIPYESEDALEVNRHIFETIYYAALCESCELANKHGTYPSYSGSPMSEGRMQHHMWREQAGEVKPNEEPWNHSLTGDWKKLSKNIHLTGVRNSLLIAPMPTASTSQILGNTESFEPVSSNIYIRRTKAGEFICINKYLIRDLQNIGVWNTEMKEHIIRNNGSVQNVPNIPDDMKKKYKTVWEISGRFIVDMAAERGPYIDQSQSFNVHMEDVSYSKLTSMHFYAWKKGLKTGMYYLRTKPAVDAIKFSISKMSNNGSNDGSNDKKEDASNDQEPDDNPYCSLDNKECLSCGS